MELHQLLGGKLLVSTAFHPQTDSATEHTIQTVSQILCSVIWPNQTDGAKHLPMVKFAMNSSLSATMGFSPFKLNYGYIPCMVKELTHDPAMPGVKDFMEQALNNLCMAYYHESCGTSLLC